MQSKTVAELSRPGASCSSWADWAFLPRPPMPSGRSTSAPPAKRCSRAATHATCCSTRCRAPSATSSRFDFKENAGTPKDLDIRRINADLSLSHLLFPRLEKHVGELAIVRSMLSHEEVHFRGQYYTQTGRQFNLAFAREIPSIGSVIAMELEPRRRPDDTFPTYMSFNLDKAVCGALSTGFLPPRFSVVDINPESAVKGMAHRSEGRRVARRALAAVERTCARAERGRVAGYGPRDVGLRRFLRHRAPPADRPALARRIPDPPKTASATATPPSAISCILARNVLAQDAGTHYIHICHPGWDHHVNIWDHAAASNHYKLCGEFDPAFSSLLEDLATIRSKTDPSKTLLDETLVVAWANSDARRAR